MEKGSTTEDLEKDYRKRAERERFRNMGSSSIGCGGQNSLEAESLRPNSPLGEWINDDDESRRHAIFYTNIILFLEAKALILLVLILISWL